MTPPRPAPTTDPLPAGRAWVWPVDPARYDRAPVLRPAERAALADIEGRRARRPHSGPWPDHVHVALGRLLCPLDDVLAHTGATGKTRLMALGPLLGMMHESQRPFWAWTRTEWLTMLRRDDGPIRHHLLAASYLLCDLDDLHAAFPVFKTYAYANKVFGRAWVDAAVARVQAVLLSWGYSQRGETAGCVTRALPALLLASRSPHVEAITDVAAARVSQRPMRTDMRRSVAATCRALVMLGVPLAAPSPPGTAPAAQHAPAAGSGVPEEWLDWCRRWWALSTLQKRDTIYYILLMAGRWLAATRPDLADPRAWDRPAAAAYVAAVDRVTVGQWADPASYVQRKENCGRPLAARTKECYVRAMGTFFRDGQEHLGVPRRFDPRRAFAVPPGVRALIGPDPRVIADDVWGKLFAAGLNLTEEDIPARPAAPRGYQRHPLGMVQALAVVWLCAGLRSDEVRRLAVGCVRWQREEVAVPGTAAVLPEGAVSILHVPANKYKSAFHKPVDRIVGEAIAAWEALRPAQLPFRDRKTGQAVHYLFAWRGRRLGEQYLNHVLIPLLCRKAGVPRRDARGKITSHRARSTIANQLFNAKEPMTLFELKAWLGHASLETTQHYVTVSPTRLAKSFADADYFRRNIRMVDVLIDQEAVIRGAAAGGAPWLYYDLGHGYCTYDYFEQCPHRLACARCSFYLPKGSMQAHLLEGQANLRRMLQEIPLRDEERAAVEEGVMAHQHLLARLAATPTPDGGPPPGQRAASGAGR
jgi:integrase